MDALADPFAEHHSRPPPPRAVTVLANVVAGSGNKEEALAAFVDTLRREGVEVSVAPLPAQGLDQACRTLLAGARERMIVAAGGDGTVNAVASVCAAEGLPLGILPLGTFNYFARRHGIPDDPAEAARLLLSGCVQRVTLGEVNGLPFLNNASFGLYTRVVRRREQHKTRFGRFRIVAVLSAVLTLLRGQKPFAVELSVGGEQRVQRSSMLFVGNNPMQLRNLDLDVAGCTTAGALAVILLKPTRWLERLRLVLRTALKELNDDHRLEMFCARDFEVRSRRHVIETVIDGETRLLRQPLRFRVRPQALLLCVPAEAE